MLGLDLVACLAVLADLLAVLGLVRVVVTAEAAGGVNMADVVGISPELPVTLLARVAGGTHVLDRSRNGGASR
jgi:hypothetical protein